MENGGVNAVEPEEIVRSFRWVPMWPGVVFMPVWAGVLVATIWTGFQEEPVKWRELILPLPLFFVFGCGILAFFNRAKARVSVARIELTHGPLPFTMPDLNILPAEVESVYWREVFRPAKGGGNYFAAGVKTRAGRHCDIFAPLPTADEARAGAMEIGGMVVAATRQGADCTAYGVQSFPEDVIPTRRLLGWFLVFLAALLFAVAMEVTR